MALVIGFVQEQGSVDICSSVTSCSVKLLQLLKDTSD
jgi:hypothetical protein